MAQAGRQGNRFLKWASFTLNNTRITLTVQNTGGSTSFRLESSPSMAAGE